MTILETVPIFESATTYNTLFDISLIGIAVCLIMGGILLTSNCIKSGIIFLGLSMISLIVFLVSVGLMAAEPKVDTGRKQYIVRLDDNFSINEFCDKYKIIEHTKYTDVYTVEEIINDD